MTVSNAGAAKRQQLRCAQGTETCAITSACAPISLDRPDGRSSLLFLIPSWS